VSEVTVEVTWVKRPDCGQLMDDHVRLRSPHSLRDQIAIKRIRDDRHSAQVVEHRPL
jgi:hypothetical protein